ncbi:MAG TPA: dihydropteroate synthase [Candidatus Dormibacteraeota bacterium]|nr:dihydropteroate synthase [Candidatus Dormibacteraeota bacterium]
MRCRAADGARFAVRTLVPDTSPGLRAAIDHLGGVPPDALPDLTRFGAADALAMRGLETDELRILTREAERLGCRVLAAGGRAVVLGPLSVVASLPERLVEFGRRAEPLGAALGAALAGRGRGRGVLTAGRHTLETGTRTLVMGIVNVTPDSFSGDGIPADPDEAVARGLAMAAAGADLLDVGGESTRPHSTPVAEHEEVARILPVVRELAASAGVPVSVDTRKAAVAEAALSAGAVAVNDVWGLLGDPAMATVCAAHPQALVVAMHNRRGTDTSADVVEQVCVGLWRSLEAAETAGVDPARVVLDPGIGFGKTPAQNLELLRRLGELRGLGRPLLVGASRKSTLGFLLADAAGEAGVPAPGRRLEGSLAAAALAAVHGADLVRVHDVAETVRALRVVDALVRGTPVGLRDTPAPGPTG